MARGYKPAPISPNSNQNGSASQVPENQTSTSTLSSARSRLTLPLNSMAIPLYNTQTREDVQEGGEVLFSQYVREEFEQQGIPESILLREIPEGGDSTASIFSQPSTSNDVRFSGAEALPDVRRSTIPATTASTPDGYKNYTWTRYGRSLRELADQFSTSREGGEVRQQADDVALSEITEEHFLNLLIELFNQGFSTERLLALFYFCSRLLIRAALEKRPEVCRHLFTWSLGYIRNKVCAWVYEHGGWEKVFFQLYNVVVKVAIVAFLTVGIVAGVVWIRKNW